MKYLRHLINCLDAVQDIVGESGAIWDRGLSWTKYFSQIAPLSFPVTFTYIYRVYIGIVKKCLLGRSVRSRCGGKNIILR